ncbi:hypothetical protein CIPAW_14G062100 [Carya illinoinensis]|uniref:Uncharacterized protein n=1 Tax=Carya illinoinensis TaxID=32201 RepID=A0A8T1NH78_CARIL|nr:hypothetical protein CIPAW_14G062100 [Carya illinoinensis]
MQNPKITEERMKKVQTYRSWDSIVGCIFVTAMIFVSSEIHQRRIPPSQVAFIDAGKSFPRSLSVSDLTPLMKNRNETPAKLRISSTATDQFH